MVLKPEELGAMLGSSLGKLEQEPEVLTTVLHIVLNLCGDLDDYDGLCNHSDIIVSMAEFQ